MGLLADIHVQHFSKQRNEKKPYRNVFCNMKTTFYQQILLVEIC